jgi:D-glycero-alpha-D-manno-heptose 1-phosphate guanylyltransferase
MRNTAAVILCGGEGQRLRPLTGDTVPKSLLPLGDRVLLDYAMEPLLSAGIGRLILATGYQSERVRQYVDTRYPHAAFPETSIEYILAPPPARITTVIRRVLQSAALEPANSVLLCDSDSIRSGIDIAGLSSFHTQGNYSATLATTYKPVSGNHWRIASNERNEVIAVAYGPPTPQTRTFIGCMMLSGVGITALAMPTSDNQPLVPALMSHDSTGSYPGAVDYFNINTPQDAQQASSRLGLAAIHSDIHA